MRSVIIQSFLVALAAVTFTTLTEVYDYDNPAVFCGWLVGLPLIVAVIANKGVATRLLTCIALLLSSFIGLSVGVSLTGA